jgi:iron complex transport system substrate-binding protein
VTRVLAVLCLLLLAPAAVRAADIVDATGRTVALPDQVRRVLPAGPPATVLLLAVAPDAMLGWPHRPDAAALALLPPDLAGLREAPAVYGREDVSAQVAALHPDLILDYGTVDDRYKKLAETTQQKTGIPTVLLDGDLVDTPKVLRLMGRVLHREARAEMLAQMAEGVLASVGPHRDGLRVVFVRGGESATGRVEVATPHGANSGLMELLGWTVLAPPPGEGARPGGAFRPAGIPDIAALDPDAIFFGSPAMRAKVAGSAEWRGLRAVREHHAWTVPDQPFGWMEGPPSVNRIVGLAWLADGTPSAGVLPFAAAFNAEVYGRTPGAGQIATLREQLRPIDAE